MPSIYSLPCEVVASILRNLDNIRSLTSAVITCRHFYSSFKESSGVLAGILQLQISPPLLPSAIALVEASRLPRPLTESAVRSLLNTLHHEPEQLVSKLRSMPLGPCLRMGHIHDVIEYFAADFGKDAWALIFPDNQEMIDQFQFSPLEWFRFCHAFYATELFHVLFRSYEDLAQSGAFIGSESRLFFERYPPAQKDQFSCVYDFLEKRFSQASREVSAHDVEFGELGVDYLSLGPSNHWRPIWLSKGVDYIHRVIHQDSYESQRELLDSALETPRSRLAVVLTELGGRAQESPDPRVIYRQSIPYDTDGGPSYCWLVAQNCTGHERVMGPKAAGLRERAYVFWDMDRVMDYELLEIVQTAPSDASHMASEEEIKAMEESFAERSEVWLKGGSGYWSKGDTSRIEWVDMSWPI